MDDDGGSKAGMLKYFAYGSNMHPGRMRERTPSAQELGRACLPGWSLKFHKRGRDQTAKCGVVRTGCDADHVWGAVYCIDPAEVCALDEAESLGCGYYKTHCEVEGHGRVFFYVAMDEHIDERLKPLEWYKRYVVEGALHHCLPDEYVRMLCSVPAVDEPCE